MRLLENMASLMKKSMKNSQELLKKINSGVDDIEEDFDLCKKIKFQLGEASFKSFIIRKWCTNDETCKLIQECEGSDNARYKTDEKCESYQRVLGVEWNEYQDIFIFRVNKRFIIEIVPLKRGILVLSALYK